MIKRLLITVIFTVFLLNCDESKQSVEQSLQTETPIPTACTSWIVDEWSTGGLYDNTVDFRKNGKVQLYSEQGTYDPKLGYNVACTVIGVYSCPNNNTDTIIQFELYEQNNENCSSLGTYDCEIYREEDSFGYKIDYYCENKTTGEKFSNTVYNY